MSWSSLMLWTIFFHFGDFKSRLIRLCFTTSKVYVVDKVLHVSLKKNPAYNIKKNQDNVINSSRLTKFLLQLYDKCLKQ